MRLYEKHILPRLTHLAMGQDQLLPYRRRAASGLHGRVLEIGIGSGLNLALYPEAVRQIIGVDPSPELLSRAAQTSHGLMPAAEMIEGVAEALPLEDRSAPDAHPSASSRPPRRLGRAPSSAPSASRPPLREAARPTRRRQLW
ncbi:MULTISPECIES: class I SAM-dependent methyltransferase [Paracoccus]